MRKRIFLTALGVLLAAMCLAGCGSKVSDSKVSESKESTASSAEQTDSVKEDDGNLLSEVFKGEPNSVEKLIEWYKGGMDGECDVVSERFKEDLYQINIDEINGYWYEGGYAFIVSEWNIYKIRLVEDKDIEHAKFHSIENAISESNMKDSSYAYAYEFAHLCFGLATDGDLHGFSLSSGEADAMQEDGNIDEEYNSQMREEIRGALNECVTVDFDSWNYMDKFYKVERPSGSGDTFFEDGTIFRDIKIHTWDKDENMYYFTIRLRFNATAEDWIEGADYANNMFIVYDLVLNED